MDIRLLCVGKNNRSVWFESMEDYIKRVQYYASFSIDYIADSKTGKKITQNLLKKKKLKNYFQKSIKTTLSSYWMKKEKPIPQNLLPKKLKTIKIKELEV
jgi:23S rRNA pseudoU1915 N3-methylase RlmH